MVRNSAHRNGAELVSRGQRQLQLFGGDDGVFEEELVKVAHPEEQKRVGICLLRRTGTAASQAKERLRDPPLTLSALPFLLPCANRQNTQLPSVLPEHASNLEED